MSLPKRVQAELQAAEALETQLQEQRAAAPGVVFSVADLIAAPSAPNEPPSEPQQVVVPEPVPPSAPVPPKDDFEHKYRVLQGMYEADVKRLRTTVESIAGELRQIKEKPAAPPAEATPADPKDIENFGADLIAMVQRYVEQRFVGVENRVIALEAQVNGVTQQTAVTAEQTFYASLDQLAPGWRDINTSERWLAWLNDVDPVYNVPRQAALDRAFGKKDAPQVATIFKEYAKTIPAAPAPSSLANQVAPSGVASVVPLAAPAKPIIAEKAITDFYRDLGQGRFRGREKEADAIEAEINAAVAEGRVR